MSTNIIRHSGRLNVLFYLQNRIKEDYRVDYSTLYGNKKLALTILKDLIKSGSVITAYKYNGTDENGNHKITVGHFLNENSTCFYHLYTDDESDEHVHHPKTQWDRTIKGAVEKYLKNTFEIVDTAPKEKENDKTKVNK